MRDSSLLLIPDGEVEPARLAGNFHNAHDATPVWQHLLVNRLVERRSGLVRIP
jgi:hypothetical protein